MIEIIINGIFVANVVLALCNMRHSTKMIVKYRKNKKAEGFVHHLRTHIALYLGIFITSIVYLILALPQFHIIYELNHNIEHYFVLRDGLFGVIFLLVLKHIKSEETPNSKIYVAKELNTNKCKKK